MQRFGTEQLKMGCDMFSTSRAIMRSSLEGKGLSETQMAIQIFIRTHGNDFSQDYLDRMKGFADDTQGSNHEYLILTINSLTKYLKF